MHNFAETPVARDLPRVQVPTRESLVVLTRDAALAETLKGLGSDHNIVTVDAETDLAGELVGNHNMSAAIIDTGAVTGAIEKLTESLKSQFPDLVLIVAGSGKDQTALAAQITSGTVYRFLHKPVSEQRVRLFVDAAWRRHGAELAAAPDTTVAVGALADERAPLPRTLFFTGAAVVLALLATGGWLLRTKPTSAPVTNTLATSERDEKLESLLARADAAAATGALLAPPGQNAAELYKQALRRNGGDPRPAAGIEAVINQLLSAAEDQLATRHLEAAQRLVDQARSLKPDHVRATFLNTRIGKERERFVLNQARQAASGGNMSAAPAAVAPDQPQAMQAQQDSQDRMNAAQHQDSSAAQRPPTEARAAGMDDASIGATENDTTAAQDNAKPAPEVVPAATLELAKYVPPSFPAPARQRGVSGWVDVQLLVKEDGSVSDVVITGAEPAGMFEQAAVDAVKEWRYKPVERDGHAVDQRARLRMKFALDQ